MTPINEIAECELTSGRLCENNNQSQEI